MIHTHTRAPARFNGGTYCDCDETSRLTVALFISYVLGLFVGLCYGKTALVLLLEG